MAQTFAAWLKANPYDPNNRQAWLAAKQDAYWAANPQLKRPVANQNYSAASYNDARQASVASRPASAPHGIGAPSGAPAPKRVSLTAAAQQNQQLADASSPVPAADSVDLSGVTTVGVNPITGQFGHLLDLTEM